MLSIVWPGDLPVTQPWGPTDLAVEPLLDGQHVHCGLDVGMQVGTLLRAPRAGRVTYVGYGLVAVSDAAQTYWFVHVDRSTVYLGELVDVGNPVAYSGAKVPSGGSLSGPHLHFEVQDSPRALLAYYDANGRLVVPAGALNNPRTCLDPVPVLTGAAGQATQGGHEVLEANDPIVKLILQRLGGSDVNASLTEDLQGLWQGHSVSGPVVPAPFLKTILDAIAAARFDPTALLAALADQKTALSNLKISGGGLTPEQDAHLAAAEAAAEAVVAALKAGLKLDIPLGSLDIKGTVSS